MNADNTRHNTGNRDSFRVPADHESVCPQFLDITIDQHLDHVVTQWPGRVAIEDTCHQWTYLELQQHVNRLAALLAETGAASQDVPVALWLPAGAPVVAAMLATLRAGGFYVVIEPDYPVARNAEILKDCDAGWVVTDSSHLPAARASFPANRVLMWNDEPGTAPPVPVDADPASRRAAIVYTSGSTGKPKGVVHSQAFILNWTRLYISDLHLSPSDRVGLLYSASVAGSIRDIFGSLLCGATLVPIAPRMYSFDELAQRLHDVRISIYHSVATLFRQLMTYQSSVTYFPAVRVLAFGGERLLSSDLALMRQRFPADALVYASIGSTETGTFARLFLRSDSDTGHAVIPLGITPPDCKVCLVDSDDKPVANGETGEIVVESHFLADSYWFRPDETAQVFSTSQHDSSLRRYHTGDFGCRDAAGLLCHAGRDDRQFTVHGNRVEAGEIEAALMSLPQVDNAIVHPAIDGNETRILACLEGRDASTIPVEILRSHCADRLPGHMMPDAFYAVDRFPRLANDKTDLQRLLHAAKAATREHATDLGEQPASPLREIWQAHFPGSAVDAQSDFFLLGGDSLTAMRLMSQVSKLGGVQTPITLLFRYPILGEFEQAVEEWVQDHTSENASMTITSSTETDVNTAPASTAPCYAQTNVQLYEELYRAGYSTEKLQIIANAYDLALRLFSALVRPEGKPFINHLVGTASILARHGATFPVVIAGLLHAAYAYGEFGFMRPGITEKKRRHVRAITGAEAEEIVYRYTKFKWNAETIDSLPERLPGMPQDEKQLVLLRLANELEEGSDASLLYCAAGTRLLKATYLELSAGVARALEMHRLAAELDESHRRNAVEQPEGRPELGQDRVYTLPVLTRLRLALGQALVRIKG